VAAARGGVVGDAAGDPGRTAAERAVLHRTPAHPGAGLEAAARPYPPDALRRRLGAAHPPAPAPRSPAGLVQAGGRADAQGRLAGGGWVGGRPRRHPGPGRPRRGRARRRRWRRCRGRPFLGGRGLVRRPGPGGNLCAAARGRGAVGGGGPLLVGGVHGHGRHHGDRHGAGLAAGGEPPGPGADRLWAPAGGQGDGVPAPDRGRRPQPGAGPAQADSKGLGRRSSSRSRSRGCWGSWPGRRRRPVPVAAAPLGFEDR
jgi:hypothetical protein